MKRNLLFVTLVISIVTFYLLDRYTSSLKPTIPTVAFLSLTDVDLQTFNGFKVEMKQYGWDENSNIKYIVSEPAGKVENLKSVVDSIIKQKPTLILVSSTPATQEVKKATMYNNIPVVFCPVNDPITSNIVANLKAPEKNITGVRLPSGDVKRFEWLHLIAPSAKNILMPFTYKDSGSILARKEVVDFAQSIGVTIIEKELEKESNITTYLEQLPQNIDAIFLPRDSAVETKIDDFVLYTHNHKLPLCVPSYQQVSKGGLFTYGFIHTELGKDAAKMVDRILKGVQPTDIPIKTGNSYLVINEKVANDIGLSFPNQAIQNAFMIIKE
jgi:putative ABC transport system substrate-binding protein